jgi:uncharacterized sulfatase
MIKRIPFLILFLCSLTILSVSSMSGLTPKVKQPNIVIFLSDDHGQEDAGCYGNPDLKTPVLDQMAAEGMKFTRAYTPVPVCAPSRLALYTGLYPHRNGGDRNHGSIREGVTTLPGYLAKVGYEVVLAGKVHVKPEAAFPFTYIERDEVPAFLKNSGEKPFCLIVAFNAPHQPYFNMKGGFGKVQPKLWLPVNKETLKYTAAYYDHVTMLDHELGAYMYWLQKYGKDQNTVQIYTSDHGPAFPFAKWTLYEQGIKVPFIVKWPGVVQPATTSDALVSLVDVLPTILEVAGHAPVADLDGKSLLPLWKQQQKQLHEEVYAAYTNLGVGGGNEYPIRSIIQGDKKLLVNLRFQNMLALESMDARDERAVIDPLGILDSWRNSNNPIMVERAKAYKKRPLFELYDLANDPYELHNLATDGSRENQQLLAKLYRKLSEWMRTQGDHLATEMILYRD